MLDDEGTVAMRIGVLALGIVLVTGCSTWNAHPVSDVQPSADSVLIVTNDRAVELVVARADDQRVYGNVVRAWVLPRGGVDLDDLADTKESPEDVADRLAWQGDPSRSAGSAIAIDRREIRMVRMLGFDGGRTGWVAGVIATPFVLLGGFALFLIAAAASCGRPLRVRGRRCITPVTRATDWFDPVTLAPVPPDVLPVLVEVWTEEAQAEHAAIAAFSKLALELLALGAPPELIARANRAALQEIQHARMCFALASAYTGTALGPAPLPQALEGDTVDLTRIAREALLDGCLREGVAAEVARLGAERARDPEVARVMRMQAREELQHADLGWAIVDWCLARGGDPLRRTLIAALREARMPRCDDLPDHGRVGRALVQPYFDSLRSGARARLLAYYDHHVNWPRGARSPTIAAGARHANPSS